MFLIINYKRINVITKTTFDLEVLLKIKKYFLYRKKLNFCNIKVF